MAISNFGGRGNELWCEGGQEKFVSNMIYQSKIHHNACLWYSTLISKEADLKKTYALLKKAKANKVRTIEMGQGNKKSRIVAWTFMSEKAMKYWNKETY